MFTRFDPQPEPATLPAGFVNPQDGVWPHPLAALAAQQLQQALAQPPLADVFATAELAEPHAGKMFGVLVAKQPDGTVGYLKAFSGMLAQQWFVAGFAPPVFNNAERAEVWDDGQVELAGLNAAYEALVRDPGYQQARARLREALEAQRLAGDAMRALHRANKHQRHLVRAAMLAAGAEATKAALDALERQSRADRSERRAFEAQSTAHLADIAAVIEAHEQAIKRAAAVRAALSVKLTAQMQASYRFANALGEVRALLELVTPPPAGTGDCAAPKLLMQAHALGLQPLALAEFWWGASSRSSHKISGNFYLPCGKCNLILPFLLRGLHVLPPSAPPTSGEPEASYRMLFEDAWLVAVDKPAGMLSVPGREAPDDGGHHPRHALSLQDHLQRRYEGLVAATFPRVVHRLDMDTSGILLAAKDDVTFAAMHRAFSQRATEKSYVALVDGVLETAGGMIDVPLSPDLDARPRQQWDAVGGKRALTTWRFVSTDGRTSRVQFSPQTGRTHQLRVHAAHPQGLGMPIVGDRLYGQVGARLMLHASALAFIHPHTSERVALVSEPPF